MLKSYLHSLFPNLTPGNALYFAGWVIIIWFLVFIILRELKCWYYKINGIITLLESIDNRLGQLNNNLNKENSRNDNQHSEQMNEKYNDSQNTTNEAAATSENVKEEFNNSDSAKQDSNNVNKFKEFMTKERHIDDIFPHKKSDN